MIIALTGLHCAGKSYFLDNIPEKNGFKVFKKNELIEEMCAYNGIENWHKWYQEEFTKSPYETTKKIIDCLPEGDVVLDSVHSNLEWEIIKSIREDAILALIVSPDYERELRWNSQYKLTDKDNLRIHYWHNESAESQCLLSQVSIAFNGNLPIEYNNFLFKELVKIIKKEKNKVKILKK